MRYLAAIGLCLIAATQVIASLVWSEFDGDVLIIGEYHDNPGHHARQQNAVNEIAPKAVVFEMLTPTEAAALSDIPRNVDAMRAATDGFHWGNIADYAAIFAVSPVIVGAAVPRKDVRAAFETSAAAVFGPDAKLYGLTDPLPAEEQAEREAAQFAAHCDAMPLAMMGGMVQAQRLRDAAFARSVIDAIETYGSPVVLITGNGHARVDWGVPVYLNRVRPDLNVESIGQGDERSAPEGSYSFTLQSTAAPQRDDPCAAFQ